MTDNKTENTADNKPEEVKAKEIPTEKAAETKKPEEKVVSDDKKSDKKEYKSVSVDTPKDNDSKDKKPGFGKDKEDHGRGKGKGGKGKGRPEGRRGRGKRDEKKDEFDEEVIDIARVTRVMAGGKRMSFRASMVIGDRKGRVGFGMGKSREVQGAIQKAARKARKNVITVNLKDGTIPHQMTTKFKAAKLIIIPAAPGTGIIAGGIVRTVLGLVGVKNILSKNLGTANKMSIAKATLKALENLKKD